MEESWEDLLCRVYLAGYEDGERERDYDSLGNKVVDAARIRAEKMECLIRELEAALSMCHHYAYDDSHGLDDADALDRIRATAYKALESE